ILSCLKISVFAPFVGKLYETLTVTTWLAQRTRAIIIPAYYVIEKVLKKYKRVTVEPFELTGDDYKYAEMTNKFLEDAERKNQDQYLCQKRRYRT
ncbi:LpxL/LpxP family acyltransferase, partial [Francisella tularensis]|nr:LPS biosynthesis protein [Francisella tularensis subsp. holarctica]